MDIKYVFPDTLPDINKEKLCTISIQKIKTKLELPYSLIIEFRKLHPSTYGLATLNSKNIIQLNESLGYKETIIVLVHELCHVEQIHKGILRFSRKNEIVYNNKVYGTESTIKALKYSEYQKLPWELDVVKKQQSLLDFLLGISAEYT